MTTSIQIETPRYWRTLIRVQSFTKDTVTIVIPGWDPDNELTFDRNILSEEVDTLLGKQRRFHARVNTGADTEDELLFKDWEPA